MVLMFWECHEKIVCCGSFRFLDKIEELETKLKKENIEFVV
jgi:hypothetical protein